MKAKKITIALAAASFAALALAGCTSSGNSGSSGSIAGGAYGSASSPTASGGASVSSSAMDGSSLSTASTSLGTIVVDGQGMTVYFYGQDTKGESTSTCTGACATAWPAVTTSGMPKVTGVMGSVGTIAGPNGTKQVTINGLPIYTYAGDGAKGDVKGQLVGNVWWAVTPAGAKVTMAASSSPSSSSSSSGTSY